MKSPDIPKYIFVLSIFNKIILTYSVTVTPVETIKLNYDFQLALIFRENITKFTFDIEACSANCPTWFKVAEMSLASIW